MLSDRIVVIDDDPKIIQTIDLIFREYDIIGFNDGKEALQFLRKPNNVLIVLLDVCMKTCNGLDVLLEIKKIDGRIAVIMMTAYGTKEVVLEALRGKADDFLDKPFHVDDLRYKVRKILNEKLPESSRGEDARVERIRRYIERNSEEVSLEHLAKEMNLSPQYLSRFFRINNAKGFRDYKIEIKMNRAKNLLKNTSLSVSQIGGQLGYSNAESFMRIFKKYIRMTPSQYRQEAVH